MIYPVSDLVFVENAVRMVAGEHLIPPTINTAKRQNVFMGLSG